MATNTDTSNSETYTGGQLPDGFSFQPGELIPTAPYIFPGEQDLCMFLELVAEYAGYFGVVGEIIAVIAEVIEVILELIDYLVSLFEGKPRSQDTLTVASRLAHGQSPIAHIMATQIHRNLVQNNIVLSSSDPGDQKILGAIRAQAKASLVGAGATEDAATKAVDDVWSKTTSGLQPLPAILNDPLPTTATLVGDPAMQLAYATHYNQLIKQGLTPAKAASKTTSWLWNTGKMEWLSHTKVVPTPLPPPPPIQPPGTPPPPVISPIGQPPEGSNQNPPPCPPFGIPALCLPQQPGTDPELDEVGQSAGQVAYWIQILAIYVMNFYQLQAGQPGQTDPLTCTQVSGLALNITIALNSIRSAIAAITSAPTPPPVDLSAITAALDSIASYGEPIAMALGMLAVPPGPIVAPPPHDMSFVDALLTEMSSDGRLTPGDLQLLNT